MEWYPWLNAPYRQLLTPHQAGRGHHALLIHALAGMGESSLSYALSRWLMCQQPEGIKSCGHCHSCQLMSAGTHPDWHTLALEKGKQSLGVDAVRSVLEKVYQRSRQGGAKVVSLPQAELLTEAAANALLKTLEEPPQDTYFFLGCREPSRLLATLRSRCSYYYLPVPDEAHAMHWLRQRGHPDEPSLQTALRLYAGAPLAADHLLQPGQWKPRLTLCQSLSDCLAQRNMLSLVTPLNGDDTVERIHWVASLFLDALKCHQSASSHLVNQDQLTLVEQLARALTPDQLLFALRRWLQCRHQLRTITGANRELLLTSLLLDWEQSLSVSSPRLPHPFTA
ncbi:DNA polymerase III subunit delta' [Lonsdalea quercina]|uniref:DNA polymerase III subunit delta' n=1 Tax=Lonsdalea quercina TaxID=71657 RepID=UPI00397564F3